ncbi:MAG: GIY-YIG nuclease family protein [bacterium]
MVTIGNITSGRGGTGIPACRQAGTQSIVVEYTVYAIKSKDGNYTYKGMTSNLDRRLLQHNKGRCKTTRAYAPFNLIYTEKAHNRELARKRERWLKSGEGREFIRERADVVELVDTQP